MVLRITQEPGSGPRTRLRLEGIFVGEGAALLERECSELLESRSAVSLDLAEVIFIDRAAIEALRRLNFEGVEIHCRLGPVASVLEGEGVPLVLDGDDGEAF